MPARRRNAARIARRPGRGENHRAVFILWSEREELDRHCTRLVARNHSRHGGAAGSQAGSEADAQARSQARSEARSQARGRRPRPRPRRRSQRNPATRDDKDDKDKKEEDKPKVPWSADGWSGLTLRGIGPAVTSGRIVDFAVDPTDKKRWYVAVASGGVWKTDQRRHHLDAGLRRRGLVLDRLRHARPEEPERRLGRHRREQQPAQRRLRRRRLQVDRRRQDAGRTSASRTSEHIGKILIDPRDSNIVYVAAQGPLWAPGGDRGLYKTTDGGKTWNEGPHDQREHRRHRRRASTRATPTCCSPPPTSAAGTSGR